MKAFLTGGTGFIGRRVVAHLSEGGHEAICLVRSTPSIPVAGSRVRHIRGDLRNRGALREGMAGCDWVLHLAAAYDFWMADRRVFRDVNVEGTRNVMECALEAGVSKVVLVSSVITYGHRPEKPVTEEVPEGPVRFSEYAETKHEGERIAWRLRESKGLPLVAVYPGGVLGPFDPKPTGEYIRAMARGRLPARVLEDAIFPFVHVEDVATAICRAAEHPENLGERYFVVAENLTFGQVNRMIREISKGRLPLLKLPDPLVLSMAAMFTAVADLTKRPPPWGLSTDQVRTMRTGTVFSGAKAERDLGIHYTPIRRAIEDAIASYRT